MCSFFSGFGVKQVCCLCMDFVFAAWLRHPSGCLQCRFSSCMLVLPSSFTFLSLRFVRSLVRFVAVQWTKRIACCCFSDQTISNVPVFVGVFLFDLPPYLLWKGSCSAISWHWHCCLVRFSWKFVALTSGLVSPVLRCCFFFRFVQNRKRKQNCLQREKAT